MATESKKTSPERPKVGAWVRAVAVLNHESLPPEHCIAPGQVGEVVRCTTCPACLECTCTRWKGNYHRHFHGDSWRGRLEPHHPPDGLSERAQVAWGGDLGDERDLDVSWGIREAVEGRKPHSLFCKTLGVWLLAGGNYNAIADPSKARVFKSKEEALAHARQFRHQGYEALPSPLESLQAVAKVAPKSALEVLEGRHARVDVEGTVARAIFRERHIDDAKRFSEYDARPEAEREAHLERVLAVMWDRLPYDRKIAEDYARTLLGREG